MISSMIHAPKARGRFARGAALLAALCAAGAPIAGSAQTAEAPAAPAPVQPQGISESVAAVVNDDIVSTFDLAQRMRLLIATSGVQPTEQNLPQFQREALISLVDERLQFQELRKVEREQKIDIIASDEEVDEELAQLARGNNMTPEQFKAMLSAQGVERSLREQLRAQISWMRWIRGRYGSRLRIGEDQIKAVQANIAASANKPSYQISEVFIDAARVGGMENAVNGANQLVTQMQQGAPFAAVARQFSAAPTAAAGGDAGWVAAGEMAPELQTALDQMRPGQLSRPIQVKDGVYIIYLRDKRSGAAATLVRLKQAAVALPAEASQAQVAEATAKLEQVRAKAPTCDSLETVAATVPGVIAGDLGEAEPKDLSPAFRTAVETLADGQFSGPLRTQAGLHVVAVCGRRAGGAAAEQVSREQIENRLYGQQLTMISRRYMRDLRSSATIETR
ncbi:peptidylprolyl isomerase [Phenylobacterium terrae]